MALFEFYDSVTYLVEKVGGEGVGGPAHGFVLRAVLGKPVGDLRGRGREGEAAEYWIVALGVVPAVLGNGQQRRRGPTQIKILRLRTSSVLKFFL